MQYLPKSLILALFFGLLSGSFLAGCVHKPQPAANLHELATEGETEEESPTPIEEMTGTAVERNGQINPNLFDWPVNEARLTRGFLPQRKRRPHLGIDLAAAKGTAILAAHDGTVIYAGRDFRGYGNMVMIEGHEGLATLYAHFSKITISEGEKVRQGDKIGEMGRTGRATGTHLHFEVRTNEGPVDPLNYLPNGALVAKLVEARKKSTR